MTDKQERILAQLSQISGQYIDEADPEARPGRRRTWLRWGAAAACLALALAGAQLYRAARERPNWETIVDDFRPDAVMEVTEIPRWEEMEIYAQYFEVLLDGRIYSVHGAAVPPERLGEDLGGATAQGIDAYAEADGEDGLRTCRAAACAIAGLAPECAVAVQYEADGPFYAAVNAYYRPATLGQFLTDLDLEDTLILSGAEHSTGTYGPVDTARVLAALRASAQAENTWDDRDVLPPKILTFSVSIPLLGYENIVLTVHEGGLLSTNILDTGKCFPIGEDAAAALVDYVLTECPLQAPPPPAAPEADIPE